MFILSLFPGIGLLDRAFEQNGFCVVRGPDVLWGGDVHNFHPPAGKFSGIIGGPPCQAFSPLSHLVRARYGSEKVADNLIPEFERCVTEAKPDWFLMENVRYAPLPKVSGYAVSDVLLNNRWFGAEQNRVRRFSFGVRGETSVNLWRYIRLAPMESPVFEYAVTASKGAGNGLKYDRGYRRPAKTLEAKARAAKRPISELARLQGLSPDFLDKAPFTKDGKRLVIGNGVPLMMGDAIAKAVFKITGQPNNPMQATFLRSASESA